jgi:EF-P beta-lysylation protein EpmB
MITHTLPTWQSKSWQEELADLVTSPQELFELLHLDPCELDNAYRASESFPLRATRAYVSRIVPGNPNDPLLRQILPLGGELDAVPGYVADPLQESHANPLPGLIHKYRGRVLFVVAPQCAINCRYCFRRHFPYQDNTPGRNQWQAALDYIREDNTIEEVIYSGGDPLVVSDRQLAWLSREIAAIGHVKRLRVHSRLPIVAPNRITEQCLEWLSLPDLQTVMVIHCNHAQEIDQYVAEAMGRLKQAGVTLLNQTVLLRGINDDSETLANLSEALFRAGVLPYYLHLLDKVAGAAHFAVSEAAASALYQSLLARLPGYLVPKLVRETPGAASKTPVL